MKVEDVLDQNLLDRVEFYARQRSLTLAQVISTAVTQLIEPLPLKGADANNLPVSTKLVFKSPDFSGLSCGKMLELLEDDMPIHKLR